MQSPSAEIEPPGFAEVKQRVNELMESSDTDAFKKSPSEEEFPLGSEKRAWLILTCFKPWRSALATGSYQPILESSNVSQTAVEQLHLDKDLLRETMRTTEWDLMKELGPPGPGPFKRKARSADPAAVEVEEAENDPMLTVTQITGNTHHEASDVAGMTTITLRASAFSAFIQEHGLRAYPAPIPNTLLPENDYVLYGRSSKWMKKNEHTGINNKPATFLAADLYTGLAMHTLVGKVFVASRSGKPVTRKDVAKMSSYVYHLMDVYTDGNSLEDDKDAAPGAYLEGPSIVQTLKRYVKNTWPRFT